VIKVTETTSPSYYQSKRQWVNEKPKTEIKIKKVSTKWHFRPRSVWPFLMWGLVLFAGFKITVIPLIEGICNYVSSTSQIIQLKEQHRAMQKELGEMRKKRDYMKTPSYVEERAHELGLVRSGESQIYFR
jgi:Septum formation initiator.